MNNYLFSNLDFFSGYSEGHVWGHKPLEAFFLILIIFFNYFLILILLKKNSFYSNFISSIFYFGISYVAYKHAITRHDAHIWHSLVFYIFLSLLLFSLFFYTKNFFSEKKFKKIFFLLFILSIYFNSLVFKNYYDTNYLRVLKNISNDVFIENLFNPIKKIENSTLFNFKNKEKNFYELKNNLQTSNLIEQKFDIFGDNPMLGFAFDKYYFPRPGNNSFNTYGFKNIYLNKKHYLKDDLKIILLPGDFTSKVDTRFFLNMDNFIWPILYENFEIEKKIIFNNKIFVKMKKVKKSDFDFQTTNTKESNFNEIIKLDYCNKNIQYCSVKLHIQKTPFGRLIDFFYKPVPYVIEFSSDNKIFKYRITFANAKNGFLIKPFFFDITGLEAKKNCKLDLTSCPKIDSFKIVPYSEVRFLNYELTKLYAKKFVIEEGILKFYK